MRPLFRHLIVAAMWAIAASSETMAETPERRVALVIGNADYQHAARLANTPNDANLIADTLRSLGFTLVGDRALLNLDKAAFDKAIRSFREQLTGGGVGLFYYAGHGLQLQGVNYLAPVDANPTQAADADFELVDAGVVLRQMEASGARLNVMILDACRNNPFGGRGLRDAGGGLAQMKAPRGTLISYATQPGNVASDGGLVGNSPYTKALAEAMRKPGLDILHMFNEVGLTVDRNTNGSQQPWVAISPIDGEFYFAGERQPPQVAVVTSVPEPAISAEEAFHRGREAEDRKDYGEAMRWYLKAADQENTKAPIFIGRLYAMGKGVPRDPAEAMRWLRKAADEADAEAQLEIGILYEKGSGVPQDHAEAERWFRNAVAQFRKAADQGDALAQNHIGVIYANGWGVSKDYAEAMRWYRKAADRGDAGAQYNIGVLYGMGRGVSKDYAEAMRWYRRAADQGNAEAQYNIGILYSMGWGVSMDFAEAMRWYRKAADQGHAWAQYNVGGLYYTGWGVAMDYAEAMRWYRKAAGQGHDRAQYQVGHLYDMGEGVATDYAQARYWYKLAAAQGNEAAKDALRRLPDE